MTAVDLHMARTAFTSMGVPSLKAALGLILKVAVCTPLTVSVLCSQNSGLRVPFAFGAHGVELITAECCRC